MGFPPLIFYEFDAEEDHIWFELHKDGFAETSLVPDVFVTPEELTAAFNKFKDCWESDYILDVAMPSYTPEWVPRSAVVGIDSARSAYTVREYVTREEFFKDYPFMTSVFEHKEDAVKEAKRICKLLNVPYVDADKKQSLADQICAASSKVGKDIPDKGPLISELEH